MNACFNSVRADVTHIFQPKSGADQDLNSRIIKRLNQGRSERLMNGGVQLKNFRIAWNISEQNSSQYLVYCSFGCCNNEPHIQTSKVMGLVICAGGARKF